MILVEPKMFEQKWTFTAETLGHDNYHVPK